jgi:hypothetical protein
MYATTSITCAQKNWTQTGLSGLPNGKKEFKTQQVFIIASKGVLKQRTGISKQYPGGVDWTSVKGVTQVNKWTWVTAGENGDVWLLAADEREIYKIEETSESSFADPQYLTKTVESPGFKQMDAGKYSLFGVTHFNEIFSRTEYNKENPLGKGWDQVPGEMAMVSTAEE